MKKYTHAWLAFMAIKRLQTVNIPTDDRPYAKSLVDWFMRHRDDVIQGAWYPDEVIKDMGNSHVLKISPSDVSKNEFKKLPVTYMSYQNGKKSSLYKTSFEVNKDDNLPDRCESIAHSVIDNLKMQAGESIGSPVVPTNNHIALLLFMLSHYIADAHVPLHCDNRDFSTNGDVHAKIEAEWEDLIEKNYEIDKDRNRFRYDKDGYPLQINQVNLPSPLTTVLADMSTRKFITSYGANNKNVWDFMSALCQYSYLLSYTLFPEAIDPITVTPGNCTSLGTIKFDDVTAGVLSDAIDSIARVWLRVWRRYIKWEKE